MNQARDIVVFCVDTLRKDHYDEYMPRLQRLADVEYTQCRASSSWTVPSHGGMFTGELPHQHGYHSYNRDFSTLRRSDTFLGDLPHRAVAVSANLYLSEHFGIDTLFDETVTPGNAARFPEATRPGEYFREDGGRRALLRFLKAAVKHEYTGRSLLNAACEFVKKTTSGSRLPQLLDDGGGSVLPRVCKKQLYGHQGPQFVYVNFMDAHAPLRHVRGFDRALHSAPNTFTTREYNPWEVLVRFDADDDYYTYRRGLYAAAVDYLDRKLSAAAEEILRENDRETTIVVTSDHGENLGSEVDNQHVGHKSSLTEGVLHVPLAVINAPDPGRSEVTDLVSLLDFGTLVRGLAEGTVPDLARTDAPAELVGLVKRQDPPSNVEFWDRMIRCLYDEDLSKVVWDTTGTVEAYQCFRDRASYQELRAEDADVPSTGETYFDVDMATYKRQMERADDERTSELDDHVERRLEELGYA